eukprot:Phypoly_transcript_06622.p1 GENE.Phypoly_transcript_06622~~Phypoly_transcript_06622.p1  ORF type:complete len:556 (+),score=96.74 Phypoly_transcript_06622:71-1738(+)
MLRFGTQYLYCPNEGCSAHTKEFRSPLVVEHTGIPSDFSCYVEKTWHTLKCPDCRCNILQCDNCFALILGPDQSALKNGSGKLETVGKAGKVEKSLPQSDFVVCLECGFINVILPTIRKKLQLKPIYPLDYATVRFIQKCICGDELFNSQQSTSPTTDPTNPNSSLQLISPNSNSNPTPTSNSNSNSNSSVNSNVNANPKTTNPNSSSNSNPPNAKNTNPNSNSNPNVHQNSKAHSNSNINSNSHPQNTNANDPKKRQLPTSNPPSKKPKIDPTPSASASTSSSNVPPSSSMPSASPQNNTSKMQEIARAETKTLESISFWNSCHKFSNSHLMMLEALYQREVSDPAYERVFSQAVCFVKEHMDIIRVKLQSEAALKVWDRLKFSETYMAKPDGTTPVPDNKNKNESNKLKANANNNNTTNSNTPNKANLANNDNSKSSNKNPPSSTGDEPVSLQETNKIIASVLWSRYDRLRRRLQFCTKPYIIYLMDINAELMQLYVKLQALLAWQAEHPTTPFLGMWDTSRERFEKEESILAIINKIILWRLFYKTVSACVL